MRLRSSAILTLAKLNTLTGFGEESKRDIDMMLKAAMSSITLSLAALRKYYGTAEGSSGGEKKEEAGAALATKDTAEQLRRESAITALAETSEEDCLKLMNQSIEALASLVLRTEAKEAFCRTTERPRQLVECTDVLMQVGLLQTASCHCPHITHILQRAKTSDNAKRKLRPLIYGTAAIFQVISTSVQELREVRLVQAMQHQPS